MAMKETLQDVLRDMKAHDFKYLGTVWADRIEAAMQNAGPNGGSEISDLPHVDDINVVELSGPKGGSAIVTEAMVGAATACAIRASTRPVGGSAGEAWRNLMREALTAAMQATSHNAGSSRNRKPRQ